MPDPGARRGRLEIVILGNMRRAEGGACSLEWLRRRVNAGETAIARTLGRLIMEGAVTEAQGVYRLAARRCDPIRKEDCHGLRLHD
jgi:hypothetical protein